jgi:hypothetical protein
MFRTLDSHGIHLDSMSIAQRERQVEEHRKLSEAAEALIANIRSRPGMERFLLPPAFASLVQSLPEGFFVFLNVSELGHQALILDGSSKMAHTLSLVLPARMLGTNQNTTRAGSSRIRADDQGVSKV